MKMFVLLTVFVSFALCLEGHQGIENQRLSLDINLHNADARVILRMVCGEAKLQLDMPDDIRKTVSVSLSGPTLREALEAIIRPAGLTYKIEQERLIVRLR
jgi:hypothetical protein